MVATERWRDLYDFLRAVPNGTLVGWEIEGQNLKKSRGALVRARQELEKEGRTIVGQSAAGFFLASTDEES